jgi:hypothetical protein
MPSPCLASKNALYAVPAGADSVRVEILDLRVDHGFTEVSRTLAVQHQMDGNGVSIDGDYGCSLFRLRLR